MWLNHLTGLNLTEQNLMKAINYRVVSVAGYVMNVCNLGKSNLNELDLIGKSVIRRERFHERQSGDERFHSKRN